MKRPRHKRRQRRRTAQYRADDDDVDDPNSIGYVFLPGAILSLVILGISHALGEISSVLESAGLLIYGLLCVLLFLFNTMACLGQVMDLLRIPLNSPARPAPAGLRLQVIMFTAGTLVGWPYAFIPSVLVPLAVFGAWWLWVLLVALILGWAMMGRMWIVESHHRSRQI